MTLRLNGATSGYSEIDAPAVAGSNTLVLPGGNGSADQALVTNGSGTLSFADRGRMVLETAKSATGTSVDFTSIPSWVKKIMIIFRGVSTAGTSVPIIQLGDSGGIETTGYLGTGAASNGATLYTTGISLCHTWSSNTTIHGRIETLLQDSSANAWVAFGGFGQSDAAGWALTGASKALSGTLDRVRITTVNGTDTFDAGTINLLLEG